jgi:hypothetical protein
MYRAALIAVGAAVLAACKTVPLDERYTADELMAMYKAPPPICEAAPAHTHSYTPDFEECAKDYQRQRVQIREAFIRAYAKEVEIAPACVHEFDGGLPRGWLAATGTENSRSPTAELIARGNIVTMVIDSNCAAAVCEWLRETRHRYNPYCKT